MDSNIDNLMVLMHHIFSACPPLSIKVFFHGHNIADAIAIPAPRQRIVGSTMAMGLLFLKGWGINTKVEEYFFL
jgi:hypothetical protein